MFVEARIMTSDLLPFALMPRRRLRDVRAEVMAYLRESNGYVERLYQLEK